MSDAKEIYFVPDHTVYVVNVSITSYCSYAWPPQSGSDSVIKLVFILFGKCTTLVNTKSDQRKPDYRELTNEKPRYYDLLGADQLLDVSSKAIELDLL